MIVTAKSRRRWKTVDCHLRKNATASFCSSFNCAGGGGDDGGDGDGGVLPWFSFLCREYFVTVDPTGLFANVLGGAAFSLSSLWCSRRARASQLRSWPLPSMQGIGGESKRPLMSRYIFSVMAVTSTIRSDFSVVEMTPVRSTGRS